MSPAAGRWTAAIDSPALVMDEVDENRSHVRRLLQRATEGDREARRGLAAALAELEPAGARATWRDVGPRYRKILFGIGEENSARRGLSREEVRKVWEAGGRLSLAQLLRCRVRYFSDGLAVGSAGFIEQVFESLRAAFSAARKTGARRMAGGDWGELRTARRLRVDPISPGGDG